MTEVTKVRREIGAYFLHKREELIQFFPQKIERILDIGCGAGGFLSNFDSQSVVRVGVEPNADASEAAREHAEFVVNDVFDQGAADALKAAGFADFDCIAFNDVLEHMSEPQRALALCKSLLSSRGFVIASIPNFLFYSNIWNILKTQDVKYEPAGIMDETHLRFFTKKSIVRLFEQSGYRVLRIQGITSVASLKFRFCNWILLNRIADLKYMQFAIVGRPVGSGP